MSWPRSAPGLDHFRIYGDAVDYKGRVRTLCGTLVEWGETRLPRGRWRTNCSGCAIVSDAWEEHGRDKPLTLRRYRKLCRELGLHPRPPPPPTPTAAELEHKKWLEVVAAHELKHQALVDRLERRTQTLARLETKLKRTQTARDRAERLLNSARRALEKFNQAEKP